MLIVTFFCVNWTKILSLNQVFLGGILPLCVSFGLASLFSFRC
jgi:hypothetical protein